MFIFNVLFVILVPIWAIIANLYTMILCMLQTINIWSLELSTGQYGRKRYYSVLFLGLLDQIILFPKRLITIIRAVCFVVKTLEDREEFDRSINDILSLFDQLLYKYVENAAVCVRTRFELLKKQ